jgi:bile acid-coenzyme A ligase
MTSSSASFVSYAARIRELAADRPDERALTLLGESERADVSLTWAELDTSSDVVASALAARSIGARSRVMIQLRNSVDHYRCAIAAWKLGACVVPLRADLPKRELDQILGVSHPDLVVSLDSDLPAPCADPRELLEAPDDVELPADAVARPGKAICSGGSTGVPKLIIDPLPWGHPGAILGGPLETAGPALGFAPDQVQLITGPLYHNAPFCWGHFGLYYGHHVVVLARFSPERTMDAIERFRVNLMFSVPTVMLRLLEVEGIETRDWSSLTSLFHGAAAIPEWLKRRWIDLLGPDRVNELYGATELTGATTIGGSEWLRRPGSVGRPHGCEIRILDEEQRPVPVGEVGEIYMRPAATPPTYEYVGSEPARATDDGFITVGDYGRLDHDGYLYIADRRVDMIVSGGANIYPAEVEGALLEHPDVADVAVIGLPDPEWGHRVHAIVQSPADRVPDPAQLRTFVRERLAAYKVPKTIEIVSQLPRNEAGKLRRSALVEERLPQPAASER